MLARPSLAALLVLFACACGGGEGGGSQPPPPPPSASASQPLPEGSAEPFSPPDGALDCSPGASDAAGSCDCPPGYKNEGAPGSAACVPAAAALATGVPVKPPTAGCGCAPNDLACQTKCAATPKCPPQDPLCAKGSLQNVK